MPTEPTSSLKDLPALHRFLRDERRAGTVLLAGLSALNALLFVLALVAMEVLP